MPQPVREVLADSLRGKRVIGPGDPGDKSAAAPTAGGCTYSRFSLSLVRHPAEPPSYAGADMLQRASALAPFLHRLLGSEPSECFGALFLTVHGRPIGHITSTTTRAATPRPARKTGVSPGGFATLPRWSASHSRTS